MSLSWIVQSKLNRPSPPADRLARASWPALASLPATTLLVAGPGYGKTVSMASWAAEAEAQGGLALWLSLDAFDAEPATLFHHLIAGMRRHIPQFGDEVLALLAGDAPSPRGLWRHFLQAVAAFNLPRLALFLDDAHQLLEGPHPERPALVLAELVPFLDRLPAGLQLVIASRRRLPLALSRLQTAGHVAVWDQARLRFTDDEAERYLRQCARDTRVSAEQAAQAARLEGWPLGLALLALPDGQHAWATLGPDPVMEYVAEEIYQAQPADRRAFMLHAASLDELTERDCFHVLGLADARAQLQALEADHLLQPVGLGASGVPAFRFPGYLRDFLTLEARRTLPDAERLASHRRVAAHHLARGEQEQAMGHLIAGEDWPAAIALADVCFPAIRHAGRQAAIERLLATFPPDRREAEPLLLLWQGHMLAREGRHPEAQLAYERARRAYEAVADDEGAFKAIVRQCSLAAVMEDRRRLGVLLLQAQALQAGGRNEDRADLHLLRALAADQRGDLALMEACNMEALAVPVGDNPELAATHAIARLNLATHALHRGDLARARDHVGGAIAVSRAWGFAPYAVFGSFLQADMQLLAGDLDGAAGFLAAPPPYWEDLLDWHDRGCALAVMARWHTARGEWREAEAALRQADAGFREAGHTEGRQVVLERWMGLALARQQYALVEELAAGSPVPEPRNIYDVAPQLPRARARQLAGDPAGALGMLEAAVEALTGLDARLHLAQARLYEAAAHQALGQTREAGAALAHGLALIEAEGYAFLRRQDPALWGALTAVTDAGTAMAPPGAPATPGGLEIRCFGTLEVRLDGMLLDQWPRRKARLVLGLLVLHPRGIGVEQLAERLAGDQAGAAQATSAKVLVSALRQVLEPELKKGAASRFIRTEDDRYVLDPDAVAASDVVAFERAIAEGGRRWDPAPHEAVVAYDRALALYRGELLDEKGFGPAIEAERGRLRQLALTAAFRLAAFHEGRGDFTAAEAALRRAAALAPCEEETYMALMRLLAGRGRMDHARQAYWDGRKALKAHLGLPPSEAFEAAYRALTSERLPGYSAAR